MKRTALTLTLALFFSFIGLAWSQVPAQRVIIVDPTGMHAASVTGGNLGTAGSASVTVDTISHITSAVHVAGIAQTVAVNCVTGCTGSSHLAVTQAGQWNVAHIGSVVHVSVVGGSVSSSGGDAVNVFHQSTIRHISSVTHVYVVDFPRSAHVAAGQSGAWFVSAHILGGTGHIAVTQATTSFKVQGDSAGTAVFVQGDTQLLAQKSTVPGISDVGVITRSAGHTAVSFVGGGHIAITQGAAALQVDCSNCSAASVVNVGHISGALHLAGTIRGAQLHIQGLGIPGQAHGGVLTIQGVAGGVAVPISGTISTDTVNVFHQSTIRHISSTTHVFLVGMSREAHLAAAQSGAWTVSAQQASGHHFAVTMPGHVAITQAGSLAVSCSNCTGGSSDAVNVFHQSTIRHISSVTHVAVTGFSREAHLAVAQSGAWFTTAHIIGGSGHIAVTQAGTLTVSCSNCTGGSSDAVNVFHQSTIRHISSVTHVTGSLYLTNQAGAAVTVTGTALDVNCTGCSAAAAVNVGHISAVMHITGAANGAIHVAGISNVGSGAPATGTTPMACHTTVAFSTTADLLLAHSQNAWKIYICSIIVVTAGAESVSIVEGTGAACGTGTRGIVGGFGGTLSMGAGGGFATVSPFPWTASSVAGNAVCLDKSGDANASGSITYRAAP